MITEDDEMYEMLVRAQAAISKSPPAPSGRLVLTPVFPEAPIKKPKKSKKRG